MVELVGVDDAAARVLDRPDHRRDDRGGDLQAGRVLVGRERARLVDRELAAEPEGVPRVPVEQHAELVHAVDDLVVHQPELALSPQVAALQLVQRQDRVVAGVVRVVDGRPVERLAVLLDRQVVGDRDRLVVRDQVALDRAGVRRPRAHARRRAGARQVDRRAAAVLVERRLGRHVPFVGSPAELGGLQPLAEEAFDRPGVDELVGLLRDVGPLRVALGDVDALDAEVAREVRPFRARRRRDRAAEVGGEPHERVLVEVAHHARVRAVRDDRRRPLALDRAHLLAQRVVGAHRERLRLVHVAAGPGLDAGVDVERADLAAQPDQVRRGHVDRQVDEEAAFHEGREDLSVVPGDERRLHEPHALELGQPPRAVVRVDHHHALARRVDVAKDQRQRALADRAEADDDDRAVVGDRGGGEAHGEVVVRRIRRSGGPGRRGKRPAPATHSARRPS